MADRMIIFLSFRGKGALCNKSGKPMNGPNSETLNIFLKNSDPRGSQRVNKPRDPQQLELNPV